MRPAGTAVKTLHPGEINIVFINRRLLIQGRLLRNDVSHHPGIFRIHLHVTTDEYCLRAHRTGHLHRHGRADTEAACLVAAARYHPAVRAATDDHGTAVEPAVTNPLHRHEKSIEVKMQYAPCVHGSVSSQLRQ